MKQGWKHISQSVTQTLTRREVPQETPALLFPTGSGRLAVQKNMTQCRLYPQNPKYVLPIAAPKLHSFLQTCASDVSLNFWALIPSCSNYKSKTISINSVHWTENLLPLLVFHIIYTKHFKSFFFFCLSIIPGCCLNCQNLLLTAIWWFLWQNTKYHWA